MNWTYEEWNAFLCRALFSWDQADSLVYVVLDEHHVNEASADMGISPEEVVPDLAAAVKSRMRLSGSHNNMFGWFESQVHFWHLDLSLTALDEDLPQPPVVALLALCSESAKEMGARGMNAANFYGQLAELLGFDSSDRNFVSRLGASYREVVEAAWHCVATWCEENEGQRGRVSAFAATGFPYVGLAVSQALVRERDRRHLLDFFRQYRLSPSTVQDNAELEEALNDWLLSPGSSASSNFRMIWNNRSARPRVVEIVMRELDQWTGLGHDGAQPRLILEASLSTFPRHALTWSLLLENASSEEPVQATLNVAGASAQVILLPTLDAELYLEIAGNLPEGAENLAFSKTNLRLPDGSSATRLVRRLIVLSRNPLTGRFEETPRLGFGQLCVVVVHGPIDAEAVRRLLQELAQPGWKEIPLNPEFAEAGVAFVNVRIDSLGILPSADWLQALVPKETSALSIEGGLSLGRDAWLLNRPPRVYATVARGAPFEIRLLRVYENQESEDLTATALTRVDSGFSICADAIVPGRYRIELHTPATTAPLRTKNIKLVTSDSVDVRAWRRSSRLVRDLGTKGPYAAISAAPPTTDNGVRVEGAVVSGATTELPRTMTDANVIAWWQSVNDVAKQIRWRLDEGTDSAVDWLDAIEALMYLGGGSGAVLTSVARQVMPTVEFASWRFWRACSDLGHVEVALDPGLTPRSWRLVRPQLAQTESGSWLLCGYWPRGAVERFKMHLPSAPTVHQPKHGPTSLLVEGMSVASLENALEAAGINASLAPGAAQNLSSVLPHIQDVVAELPSSSLPGFDRIQHFDPASRGWRSTDRVSAVGAYRASVGSMQRYLVVTEQDLAERRCHFADADLAKHVAASMDRRPFLAYHSRRKFLVTPFGVRLPHLYGRAATLCSGRISYSLNNSWTVYEDVPAHVAIALQSRLTWKS